MVNLSYRRGPPQPVSEIFFLDGAIAQRVCVKLSGYVIATSSPVQTQISRSVSYSDAEQRHLLQPVSSCATHVAPGPSSNFDNQGTSDTLAPVATTDPADTRYIPTQRELTLDSQARLSQVKGSGKALRADIDSAYETSSQLSKLSLSWGTSDSSYDTHVPLRSSARSPISSVLPVKGFYTENRIDGMTSTPLLQQSSDPVDGDFHVNLVNDSYEPLSKTSRARYSINRQHGPYSKLTGLQHSIVVHIQQAATSHGGCRLWEGVHVDVITTHIGTGHDVV
jgi:hypothetical protein